MEGLTAKVFRTYNASSTLESELKKKDLSKLDIFEKLAFYDEANRQVAILCNHQKTVSKNFDIQKDKISEKISDLEEHLAALNTHLSKLNKDGKGIDEDEWNKKFTKKKEKEKEIKDAKLLDGKDKKENKDKEKEKDKDKKEKTFKFPSTADKVKSLIAKTQKQISNEKFKLTSKEGNKSIALGTSKLNYNDPRITVKWCKVNEVPIEKVFAKSLRSKFPWAMPVDLDWTF